MAKKRDMEIGARVTTPSQRLGDVQKSDEKGLKNPELHEVAGACYDGPWR
jgi:hypothetical protein